METYIIIAGIVVVVVILAVIFISFHMDTMANNFKNQIDLEKDFSTFKWCSKAWRNDLNETQRAAVEKIIPHLPKSGHPTAIGVEFSGMSGYFCWIQLGPKADRRTIGWDDVFTQFRVVALANGKYIVILTNKKLGRERRGYFEVGDFDKTLVHIQEAIEFDKTNNVGIFEHE